MTTAEIARAFMRAFTRPGSRLAGKVRQAGGDRGARQEAVMKWLNENPKMKKIFRQSGFHVNDLVSLATDTKK